MKERQNESGLGTEQGQREEISRIDKSLEIMDDHGYELSRAEAGLREEMRRRDREYRDQHLHSVPRSRKHQP